MKANGWFWSRQSTFQSFSSRQSIPAQGPVPVEEVLVSKERQVQQSWQGIVCRHKSEHKRTAKRAQIRSRAEASTKDFVNGGWDVSAHADPTNPCPRNLLGH